MTQRVSIWSGPRNISTALMYSFRQRADTTVVDEPLYAQYLRATGLVHPGGDAVKAGDQREPDEVIDTLLGPWLTPVVVFKQMAHHLDALDATQVNRLLQGCTNVLLVRRPRDVVRSFARQIESPTLADLGYERQVSVLEALSSTGVSVPVVDSTALLANPQDVLSRLCEAIGVPPDDDMLAWEAGPKPEDGSWAPHWYANVHASEGFGPPRAPDDSPLAPHLEAIVASAEPLYQRLMANA